MSNIDKHAVQAVADLKAGYTLGNADVAILNELARIALASLEAEPVAWLLSGGGAKNNVSFDSGNAYADPLREVTPLYTAPPAPVAMKDHQIRELVNELRDIAVKYHGSQQLREHIARTIRAAMLQGVENAETPTTMQTAPALDSSPKIAESPTGINQGKSEPVTTANKLSFEQWLSQQTGTIDVECGCVMTEVFFHWLRVAYEAGNSPHCREILNSSTKNFRENAETSTKCWCRTCRPVTFADSHFVVCPECGNKRCPHANDHRNACTGSNEPGQEGSAYPAAPRQEVK